MTMVAPLVNDAAMIVPRMSGILPADGEACALRTRCFVTAQPVMLKRMNTPAA